MTGLTWIYRGSESVPVRDEGPQSFPKHCSCRPAKNKTQSSQWLPPLWQLHSLPPSGIFVKELLTAERGSRGWHASYSGNEGKQKVIFLSPYRFKDSLSVFSSFQADLFPNQVCIVPFHLSASFGLRFNSKQVILVSQLYFMFNGSWEEKKQILITAC